MSAAIAAVAVGVAGIGANVALAKQGADAAKKAGRKARSQAEEDRLAAEKADRLARVRADNDTLFENAKAQLAQAGYAGQNAEAGISPQVIVPVALGTVAVALSVIMLARRKR